MVALRLVLVLLLKGASRWWLLQMACNVDLDC